MNFPRVGRVLFSATLVRGHIAKFHIPYLKWFKEQGWETWVAAKNDYPDGVCDIPYCDYFVDVDFARSPFSSHTLTAYRELRNLFKCEHFDIVHTHTPVGSVLTRLAAQKARRDGTKVIYTAHGFHFYNGAPLKNWILWYPVERALSQLCDLLITINHEDYERACSFSSCNVAYVPGVGIDLSKYKKDENNRDFLRDQMGLRKEDFVVLSVGDINKNKNQRVLIESLPLLPQHVKLLLVGDGKLRAELESLVLNIGLQNRVSFLGFRDDVPALLNICDLFCLPSKREGLPVSLIEAAAAGVACLASSARGCEEVLGGQCSGKCIIDSGIPMNWAKAIGRFVDNDFLRIQIGNELRKRSEIFEIESLLERYSELYAGVLNNENA